MRSRHEWLPSALTVFFGEESTASDAWTQIRAELATFVAEARAIREGALRDAASVDGLDLDLHGVDTRSWADEGAAHEEPQARMRVVLMGRTMAGKSSLLAALSGKHFDRIGDGRQRFSRDIFAASPKASDRIEIVDTPGVGAADGAEDVALAFSAVRDADLIVWVASSDSIQEETARPLRQLGLIGKPILVALNCRQSLHGVGKLNLLRFPERVFGHREGLVAEIRRHMAAAGVEPLKVINVHALAASEAVAHGGDIDEILHKASRIDDLTSALDLEHAAHSESRRALRVVDGPRNQVETLSLALAQGSTSIRRQADRNRTLNEDVHARLRRLVRSAGEGMVSDISIIVGRRREWHLTVTEFGNSLQQDWEAELDRLQAELNGALDTRLAQLRTDVDSTFAAADAEWASVSSDQFSLRDLTGFHSILGNRIARAGIAAVSVAGGIVGLKLGAAIGGALGLPTGPGALVTAAVGGLVGAGLGVALVPLKRLADTWILGKDGVLHKRRDEVAKQVGPRLDDLTSDYEKTVQEQLDGVENLLAAEHSQNEERSASLDALARSWSENADRLWALIRELDKQTTAALLRITGRERLASSLRRVTRVPGVCILAEFDDSGFSESWLFPPSIGEKLAGGRAPNAGGVAAGALSYALSLADTSWSLVRADATSATLSVDEDVPANIADTWADALSSHTGTQIRITSTRRVPA